MENNRPLNILKKLKEKYPNIEIQLIYKNPFELLIATILSAQCTDIQVNKVTPTLFNVLKTPYDMTQASLDTIERLIRSIGLYKNKARYIQECSRQLINRYNGEVPNTLDKLVSLTGVGRKTANVVLGNAFGIPGITVDTHVSRISQRLKLTQNVKENKIEQDLMGIIPKEEWTSFSLRMISFGREICQARTPKCYQCMLYKICKELKHET